MKKYLANFKVKLILSFTFFLIIPTFSVGILSYVIAKNSVEEEILRSATEQLEIIDESIYSMISMKIHDIEVMAKNITANEYRRENQKALREKLQNYAEHHPETQRVYIGTPAGLFIVEPKFEIAKIYDPRKEDWFVQAMENKGEIIFSAPYKSDGSGAMVVTISKTTEDGNGVVGIDIYLSHLQDLIGDMSIGKNGYVLLLDENKNYIVHHDEEKIAKNAEESIFQQIYNQEKGKVNHVFEGKQQTSIYITNELTNWKIVGNIYDSEIKEAGSSILKSTMMVLVVVIIAGVLIGYFIIKSLIKPIKVLKEKAHIISQGNLKEDVHIETNDEIGQLGMAFNEMQSSLRILVEQVDDLAEHVVSSAQQLTLSAEQTTKGTEQVTSSIQQVASGAEKQSEKIEWNSRLLNKVQHGTNEISEKSLNVAELAHHAKSFAQIGGQAIHDTVKQMKSIQQSVNESNEKIQTLYERSRDVKTILDVIVNMAEQTQLLSLNAAIEAARAGENGKGFAVVANEVRNLAEESKKATQKISDIVYGIQTDTNISVTSMEKVIEDVEKGLIISNEANEKFTQIIRSTSDITEQIEDISHITKEMRLDVKKVMDSADEIASITQENAAASEEVAASSEQQLAAMEEITNAAKLLANKSLQLKGLLTKFHY